MEVHHVEEEEEAYCDGCGVGERRYRCPGCGVRSCSVMCVKRHKEETGCQGNRSKTSYVSISNFTTSHLLSDYYFLEEAGRLVDSAHRGYVTMATDGRFERRQRLQRVRNAARKRGISLQLLPGGMTRHKINTSTTVWNRERREWSIEWRVKLVFSNVNQSFNEDRVNEDENIESILNHYLHPSLSHPLFRHRLKNYVGRDVAVYLRREQGQRSESSDNVELDKKESLRKCLRNKTIVEFPEIHIHLSSPPPSCHTSQPPPSPPPPSYHTSQPPPPPLGAAEQCEEERILLPTQQSSSLSSLATNYCTDDEEDGCQDNQ